jgi:hypothetical protein
MMEVIKLSWRPMPEFDLRGAGEIMTAGVGRNIRLTVSQMYGVVPRSF